jgi:hypothetical protein
MLSKEFLLFHYKDWQQNLKQLHSDLAIGDGSRSVQLERIRKAEKWVAHYARQLRDKHGIVSHDIVR